MENRDILLQELHVTEEFGPWRVLVTCQMLNQTTWMQAAPILTKIFEKWPTPHAVCEMRPEERDELRLMIAPAGFAETRARRIVKMSEAFVKDWAAYERRWRRYDVMYYPGCGQYALDAWRLFVLKEPCHPKDRRLLWYAEKSGLLLKEEGPVDASDADLLGREFNKVIKDGDY